MTPRLYFELPVYSASAGFEPRRSTPMVFTHTPAMQQFHRMKAEHPDALLFFRMGDFYELFFEDAEVASASLEIALTSRSKGSDGEPIPMCGVPHHSATGYIARLVRQGFRVALCEQMEDPRTAKGVVKREVVRVITPGTQLEAGDVEPGESSYVLALVPAQTSVGAAYLDATTGDFNVVEWTGPAAWESLRDEMSAIRPREILVHPEAVLPAWFDDPAQPESGVRRHTVRDAERDPRKSRSALLAHFGTVNLTAFGCEELPLATTAAALALRYVQGTQKRELPHVTGLRTRNSADALVIDRVTRRNLELVESLADGGRAGTLLHTLDQTGTAMGSRLMREWVLHPLVAVEPIQDRLDAVEELAFQTLARGRLREALKRVQDLDRLVGRITLGTASPRDLVSLAASIRALPAAVAALDESQAPLLRREQKDVDPPLDAAAEIEQRLVDSPPASLKEGGLIRDGYCPELDELRQISQGGRTTISGIETRERERTGIANLKVRFNRVFGYFIEVSKSQLSRVPDDYIRKQTIANGERYITIELKEYEEKVLRADERIQQREMELFEELRSRLVGDSRRIQRASRAVAALDVLATLAEVATRYDYVKPRISPGDELSYRDARHPVMERVLSDPFVANDLALVEGGPRLMILTGPNMGGKSTFLRQTALLPLLAQMGSFVPATEARIGLVDRIFTRVGASDQILRGQSTFMVEMQETAHILRHATPRSLILLDEIGRGTATFDGLSIAWAVAEHIAGPQGCRARTLFATHYHELTDLAADWPGVGNLHVAAREWKDTVVFLRKIESGGSDRSFGIQVARLAGLPPTVVVRATEILRNLERTEFDREGRPRLAHAEAEPLSAGHQLTLFGGRHGAVVEELRNLDLEQTTPLQALARLVELQRRVSDSSSG